VEERYVEEVGSSDLRNCSLKEAASLFLRGGEGEREVDVVEEDPAKTLCSGRGDAGNTGGAACGALNAGILPLFALLSMIGLIGCLSLVSKSCCSLATSSRKSNTFEAVDCAEEEDVRFFGSVLKHSRLWLLQ